ncbi:hypothetical protein SDC9_162790 [bioreactor metagenome]|uniref:Uncharacterized protein n=1 Tax=bioreactor metagenome TaxID=1076179 RepID=A0A645FP18_9ZZZZ
MVGYITSSASSNDSEPVENAKTSVSFNWEEDAETGMMQPIITVNTRKIEISTLNFVFIKHFSIISP